MAPTPKRKHSTARKGARMSARKAETKLPNLVKDAVTGELKKAHRTASTKKF